MKLADARLRLSLGLCGSLALCGCAATSSPPSAAAAAAGDEGAYQVADVELPAQERAVGVRSALLDRSKIAAGAYLAHVSFSSHHGCSQSWASSSLTGTMKLVIVGDRASLELDLDQSSVSGSRHHPGDAYRDEHEITGTWEGKVEPHEGPRPSSFRARLTQRSCSEGCADPIEIECERDMIRLSGRADLPAEKGPTGGVQGVLCRGLGTALPSSGFEVIPMAPGAGVALSSAGYGSELRVSYPQPLASR